MLASLLRPKKRRVYAERSPFSSPYTTRDLPWPFLQRGSEEAQYEEIRGNDDADENVDDGEEDESGDEDDGPFESSPLLPIFSASHLDTLPVYDITHTIRALIAARCETTLSWDQLRSPQISQFLVKPIQQQIRAFHFSRATLYALLTNCLQFNKEVHLNPGNSGTSQTRAMVSELLAIKLLREYTTRELIDALSYEFFPLQGQSLPGGSQQPPGWTPTAGNKRLPGVARISCLEVAIRAQAKRFLSHPLVVQQLEAIWAGTIVFHSAADYLHRSPTRVSHSAGPTYGTTVTATTPNPFAGKLSPRSAELRRSVTLYDPRDASLFKLSRLRVPRYRQFLSTLSFAVLLALFLAVLDQRRVHISALEVVFWFWSAGFMLDELVGFNEQGFSLYLMSFWNLFDLGILFLLFCYYCLRLYGAFMPFTRKQAVADQAYDILAANAVLLFPRLFSILDHYRYFSQLLIAFRIMASDLVAVFFLIIIACSGFFVAFTLSFGSGEDRSPGSIARFKAFSSRAPRLVREPSVATYQKDRALEEVFRRPFHGETMEPVREIDQRKTNKIVKNWMQTMGPGPANPPDEQDSDEVSQLEKRPQRPRHFSRRRLTRSLRDFTESNRSVVSNPEDHVTYIASSPATPRAGRDFMASTRRRQLSRHTGMEGDVELTSDGHEDQSNGKSSDDEDTPKDESPGKATPKFYSSRSSTAKVKSRRNSPVRRVKHHSRSYSGATMLYRPLSTTSNGEETEAPTIPVRSRAETPDHADWAARSTSADRWAMRRHSTDGRSRNVTMPISNPMSVPEFGHFLAPGPRYSERGPDPILHGLGSDIGDNKAIASGFVGGAPSSLTTQMAYATGGMRRPDSSHSSQDILSKLVLARMNNIEEGFREVIREMKDLRREGTSRSQSGPDESKGNQREKKRTEKKGKKPNPRSRRSKTGSEEQSLLLLSDADTLLYIDPPPQRSCASALPRSSESIPHRIRSQKLLETGSNYFKDLFQPRAQARTISRRGLGGKLTNEIHHRAENQRSHNILALRFGECSSHRVPSRNCLQNRLWSTA
ncbi:unnamed protein product [Aspergillus oryzae RIB40]|uniref:DNA, SC023 n=1 Tax=Aspergillus oryzae (strain ATCC 42149 / RIB 40) TaxID=510516 RepID=Q2UHE0_ASPOR|nr:unnamed protein product [Aspergillus oryzae RIB40]BAE59025.1 unnamed protein product [Aspergillus oryzae RIB40]